ncbi:Crp/Fnr family transcriptional regulator [Methylobacterium sp. ID0610]|uniref:Crp/Fnr family transcriptional regulator n=1 Tax=Methylobacterium carpenticola TaxID=3344827 RepID=UPI003683A0F4
MTAGGICPSPEPRPEPDALLRRLASHADLTEAEIGILSRLSAAPRAVGPRSDLLREGEDPGGAYVILSGAACRYKQRPAGGRHIVSYLLPGDVCDADGALLRRADFSAAALAHSSVAFIPRPLLRELTAVHDGIAQGLRAAKLVEEAILRMWLANLGCRSALERTAHLFCELLERFQVVGLATGAGFDLPITQVDLSLTLGMSTVHLNRTLHELRRQGAADLRGRSLRVLDRERLTAIAEFDPSYLRPRLAGRDAS